MAEPWPLKLIFDNVLLDKPLTGIPQLLIGPLTSSKLAFMGLLIGIIIAIGLLGGFFYYYQDVYMARVGQEVTAHIRRDLYWRLQRLSLRFHERSRTGDLLMRLTGDIWLLRELLVAVLLSTISEGTILLSMILIMFLMDWQLAAVAVLIIPLLFTLARSYRKKIKEATHKQRKREGQLASLMQETISAVKVVQAFVREKYELARFEEQNQRSLKAGIRTSRLEAKLNRRVELALAVATGAVLALGVNKVLAGLLTPGDLLVFLTYVRSFYRPLRRLSKTTERGAKALASAERVLTILEAPRDMRDCPGALPAPCFRGEIAFEKVSFAYSAGQSVLRGIDLNVQPAEKVAIVGSTGAGKSTLVSLIPRFYDPTEGRVFIDGRDIREYRLASLRKQIALVLQEPIIFGTTIRENIAYGKPDASMERIIKAARHANIHDFILSLPEGYETVIGERGATLSGGQRQRIAIARALVRRSPIVILDEPTVGLDAQSEALVLEAVRRLMEGRTVFMIAHHFRTLQDMDRIIVLEDGRIVEEGTHAQLIERGNRYRHLYDLQVTEKVSIS
jgi:ABC-type multidrug transport system fused ATPase/permease subunit